AAVRVMTVHQAKGLEFDVVILPELDLRLIGGGGRNPAALPERDPETGRIVRVFPYVKTGARDLVPEVGPAAREDRRAALRDALGVLYVGMTRARFALHLLVAADPDGGPRPSPTFARLLREALDASDVPVVDGDILFEDGSRDWPERVPEEARRAPGRMSPPEPVELDVRLAPTGGRRRILPHRTPSDLEGGETVRLSDVLSLDEDGSRATARREGIVVHEWCRSIEWMDEGLPDTDALLSTGRRVAPDMSEDELKSLLDDFFGWLELPAVRRVLSRPEAKEGEEIRLEAEWPFAVRRGDEILRGVVDRLVLFQHVDGRVRRARILDFKTDGVGGGEGAPARDMDPAAHLVERYRPQLEAYRDAVSRTHAVEKAKVEALLVFLAAGRVVPV
ncbi:MAG: 3'-5' exonuclease, partial [Longimicrobiales bacterium]|nr:3'-5' exonuclease [Longimicrobiales bacterium]